MFEKIGRLAEKAATNVSVSRRGFLGRLSKAALAVAGVLVFVSSASAGRTRYSRTGLICCGSCGFVNGRPLCTYACYPGHKCPPGTFKAKRGMCGEYC